MGQGQTVGSRGQSEESENPDPHSPPLKLELLFCRLCLL
jgi:hypothetical protein